MNRVSTENKGFWVEDYFPSEPKDGKEYTLKHAIGLSVPPRLHKDTIFTKVLNTLELCLFRGDDSLKMGESAYSNLLGVQNGVLKEAEIREVDTVSLSDYEEMIKYHWFAGFYVGDYFAEEYLENENLTECPFLGTSNCDEKFLGLSGLEKDNLEVSYKPISETYQDRPECGDRTLEKKFSFGFEIKDWNKVKLLVK